MFSGLCGGYLVLKPHKHTINDIEKEKEKTPPVKVAVGPWLRRRAGLTLMALYREGRRNRDEGFLRIVVLRASR